MCTDDDVHDHPRDGVSRRSLLRTVGLVGTAGLAVGPLAALELVVPQAALAAVAPDPRFLTRTPRIHPRSGWAGTSCPVKGRLYTEQAGNVKYLLCHHSAIPNNTYTATQVPGIIRDFYKLHTGDPRYWPDVAYNFFVDRFGGIWEGRQGSTSYPRIPSATGGNQGFDQIVCWIGNHTSSGPTPQALGSMISMLAWLGTKYKIDTRPGIKTSFISRGSNKWPKGTRVTTRTIEGHRYMSKTVCPGDAAYAYVPRTLPNEVTKLRQRPT